MRLTSILGAIGASCAETDIRRTEMTGLTADSREAGQGDLFFAVEGASADGHDYLEQAQKKGAVAAVVSRNVDGCSLPQILVPDTREALALAACEFYNHPSESFPLIGITGTNGKTTVAWLVHQLMQRRGICCGLLGTIYNVIAPDDAQKAGLTTAMPHQVQRMLAQMRDRGNRAAVMEVSSHALDQKRTMGTRYQVAVFTNLTPDHLDYHTDMDSYFDAKTILFKEMSKTGRSVVGLDDPWGEKLAGMIDGPLISFGRRKDCDIRITGWKPLENSSEIELEVFGRKVTAEVGLLGGFNAQNIAAACGVAVAMGISADFLEENIPALTPVPGRMEPVLAGQNFNVLVDYAHTPDALDKALDAAREHTTGKLVSIVGCGGDRMKEKRAPMGKISLSKADFTVVTSDNPRSENPKVIIEQILEGVSQGGGREGENYIVEPDRRKAIHAALEMMADGDTLLIAGKGHEDYQILPTGTIHFDDREVAREKLGELGFK
ncbi:MAG: UDP-N-acetylmuramoyl-L-alanyl-D-glutamate--2,6-diaminopimelate ligase [Candidatus Glassbacteria bacterium]|nr:UDP-N-acetylmuramoyl-L-alanyl-D-glutamate--2,6-diaminopimelate ligase [Candidatus Glassbacteria bacterium]